MISLPLFALSVVFYTLSQMSIHGKLSKDPASWFGSASWLNKYKKPLQAPPNNRYYKLFKILHKERFPGSATIFVTFTDSYHFFQFCFKILLTLSIVFYRPVFGAWLSDALLYFALFGVSFTIAYRVFSK